MKVSIIGYGFVGNALKSGLKDNLELLIIDPKLNTSTKDLKKFKPEIIFICVPTPMSEDGTQDLSIIKKVLKDIKLFCDDAIVVLKSTVLPSYISLVDKMITNLVINPEFLREASAADDFIKSELILFGGDKENCLEISSFYKDYTKCINQKHMFVDLISASLIKYTINTFLATKVIFFNEIKNIFDKSGSKTSWDDYIDAVSLDNRIGDSHMNVPGPDGRYGTGEHVFLKDTLALYKFSQSRSRI